MAKTVILIIALAISCVASFFSLSNLGRMKEERMKIYSREADIDKVMLDIASTQELVKTRRAELAEENKRFGELSEQRNAQTKEVETMKAQLPELDKKIAEQVATIAKFEEVTNSLKSLFSEMNVNSLEEMNDTIKKLANNTVAREKELAEQKALVEIATEANARLEEQVSSGQARQAERVLSYKVNSAEASIVAVNNDWGFVVINSGSDDGFKSDNQLLVKRGDQYIARLTITTLNKSQMVADIQQKSVVEGFSVRPGDKVILARPNQ